jgi:hypothetical protein
MHQPQAVPQCHLASFRQPGKMALWNSLRLMHTTNLGTLSNLYVHLVQPLKMMTMMRRVLRRVPLYTKVQMSLTTTNCQSVTVAKRNSTNGVCNLQFTTSRKGRGTVMNAKQLPHMQTLQIHSRMY